MFEIVVYRIKDGKKAVALASTPQMLLDHLKASATRHGFGWDIEVGDDGLPEGDILKGDVVVATWFVLEVSA